MFLPLGSPPRVALLALLWSLPVWGAGSGDDWLGPDKPKHFVASVGLAGVGYGAGAVLFEAPRARGLTGAGLSLSAGLGKELYDWRWGSGFSTKDLVWDVAGTTVGLGLAWLLDTLLGEEAAPAAPPVSGSPDGPGKPGTCALHMRGTRLTDVLLICTAARQAHSEAHE